MAAVYIPTPLDTPLFNQRVTLDGREFLLEFDWNDRAKRWYLSVFTVDNVALVAGLKIICNWPLLRRSNYNPELPQGRLIASDFGLLPSPPVLADLGRRVRLIYIPEGDTIESLAPEEVET